MAFIENIKLALAGIRTSKMRSLLTMLGIIIGIGAVIGIVTIGDSLTNNITGSLSQLGANNIYVIAEARNEQRGMVSTEAPEAPEDSDLITLEMIESVQKLFADDIDAVSYSVTLGGGTVQDGRKSRKINLNGVNEAYDKGNQIKMQQGRFLKEKDLRGEKNVAVISDKVATKIFGTRDPLQQEIKVYVREEIYAFMVVGVYTYEANAMMGMPAVDNENLVTDIYIPATTAQRLSGKTKKNFEVFTVTGANGADIDTLAMKLSKTMDTFYEKNKKFNARITTMESVLDQMNSILGTVSIGIAVIAGISLLVGGIGVMNIMLVSVTERTREIGTRKALGARQNAIRAQFIIESIILCLIGGMIGILVGLGIGSVGGLLLGSPASPSIPAIIIAVVFSMVIGIFFGYYPANKAAKLDPIEALRYE